MRLIAIANHKGGVGKTTVAVNLAAGLAKAGRRTLLVDADAQSHATTWLSEVDEVEHDLRDVIPSGIHPGQRPVYEVLPTVPIPVPTGPGRSTPTPDHIASSGRTAAGNGSHGCDPPYKPQGITPLPPTDTLGRPGHGRPGHGPGGRGISTKPTMDHPRRPLDPASTAPPDAAALTSAAIAALRPEQRARVDELGHRRLERAAQPLVGGWDPH